MEEQHYVNILQPWQRSISSFMLTWTSTYYKSSLSSSSICIASSICVASPSSSPETSSSPSKPSALCSLATSTGSSSSSSSLPSPSAALPRTLLLLSN